MAKYLRRSDNYVLLATEGDSTATIAEQWTLSPAYAVAIENANGMAPGEVADNVGVPLNWLKPEILQAVMAAPAAGASSPLDVIVQGSGKVDWLFWGAVGLAVAGLLVR